MKRQQPNHGRWCRKMVPARTTKHFRRKRQALFPGLSRLVLKGTSKYSFPAANGPFAGRLRCKNSKDFPSIPAFLRLGGATKISRSRDEKQFLEDPLRRNLTDGSYD